MANFSKPQNMMSMLVALFALLQVSVAFHHHGAHHYAHPARSVDSAMEARINEVAGELEKRQSQGYVAITGVCTSGTESNGMCKEGRVSYPRLELRELQKNADQWNLYLLGMERFMAKDMNDPLSFYQIAGIHGQPYKTWGGFPTPLKNQAGFCPHGNTMFVTWHRPYLALFEQAWYQCVLEVVAEFPSDQQTRWRNAAATLRIPYWDFAIDAGEAVPSAIRDQRVTVTKPSGPATIPNPLYSYSWGQSVPSEVGTTPWNNWPTTLRRPVGNPTRSNNNELLARLNAARANLRDRIFALFASKQKFGDVATSAIGVRTSTSGSGVDSFESVHDTIHNTVGGESGGHMYHLEIAAYEPIFFLLHAGVDRLTAMYQLIVPDSYVSPGNIQKPMAQWNTGEPKNSYTPLKPFTKDNAGNYFNSMDVRETRSLGYHYLETADRSYQQVARAVTALYGGGSNTMTKRTDDKTGQFLGRSFKEGDYHYVLNIIASKFAMDGSYTVHCFLGKPSDKTTGSSTAPYPVENSTVPYPITNATGPGPIENSTSPDCNSTLEADYDPSQDYTQGPNYVGSYGILGGMKAGGGNASALPLMTRGSIPLTTALQGKEHFGELASLKPEDVEPYLAEHLHIKVVGLKGELDPDEIPHFHVSVGSTKVILPENEDDLPDLSSPYKVLHDATINVPAGKPFEYVPTALDIPLPDSPEYIVPSQDGKRPTTPFPVPNLPWEEDGYCASKQVIHYVDPAGNFLYAEM
ncbi:hypothetical protein IAQ61_010273 [Plenodomus lingam]|uniref:tyrosinase n=1 Tax=Leptosphaeria maculans (strain JN3 / isolate v23.1.3 / race Av1-4-5-6-7-8) TaxID=985895 RepID=E5A3G2_LEPMJ|nr:hypothetical protein LEMA_P095840.1 [Plenodomus lingam JN3]KAH9862071.1 hypothetical protein IAQ61_010273 [Plenodomus lingam]CBX98175.1 hypothetical protein LEMA_P095840.1 [Plenodomus lingam JN3]